MVLMSNPERAIAAPNSGRRRHAMRGPLAGNGLLPTAFAEENCATIPLQT
jgi:hypothetical protein